MPRLENKLCVVTGAAAGIGYQTALAFAAEGAHVLAVDRDTKGLEALKIGGLKIDITALDVTDPAAVTGFFAEIEGIDALFNCAGMVTVGKLKLPRTLNWMPRTDNLRP